MCPECNGLGRKVAVVADDFLDLDKSLNEGAIQVPVFVSWEVGAYTASGFFDNDKKLRDFTPEEMDLLLWGKDRKYQLPIGDKVMNASYVGVLEKFERAYVRRDIKTLSQRVQKTVAPYLRPRTCPLCHGARLNQAALRSRINGYSIADFAGMEIDELIPILRLLEEGDVAAPDRGDAHRAAPAHGRHRARVPEPGPRDRHALGRRGAAREAGQAPRQQPGRRGVHPRRAVASGSTRATSTG